MGEMTSNQTFDILRIGERAGVRTRRVRNAQWVAGTLLSATGLIRRGWFGAFTAGAGAALLVHAAMNDDRFSRPLERLFGAGDRKSFDSVDSASFESFPASDPPASTRVD